VFSEIFLVQIRQKFREIHFEVRIQGKKKSENVFQILKSGQKNKFEGKKEVGRGENFPNLASNCVNLLVWHAELAFNLFLINLFDDTYRIYSN
jgi:hypothetical protein